MIPRSFAGHCLLIASVLFIVVGVSIVFQFKLSSIFYILAMLFFSLGIAFRKG